MINRAFSHHCANRSFQNITSFSFAASAAGSVTLAKSNSKALLTGTPIKNADLQAGFALSEGQGRLFEKKPPAPRKNFIRDGV